MSQVQGTCDPKFAGLKKILEDLVASEEEVGASLYVDIDGEAVVDIYGGFKDETKSQPWTADVKTAVFSTSKCIANLALLVLVDRGLLDLDAKISKYWPEFAANGKDSIEIRHILSHSTGLSGWDEPITIDQLYDHNYTAKLLEQQAPWWEPGSASGYHAVTQGVMIEEIIRRVTGASLKDFIEKEFSRPLNADYSLGVAESDWHRVAPVIPIALPFKLDAPADTPLGKTLRSLPLEAHYFNEPPMRKASLGAANGYGNARSVARIMSSISRGGAVDGHRFLGPETLKRIFQKEVESVDLVEGIRCTWGPGYCLAYGGDCERVVPKGNICFWGGWGGSIIIMDADRKATICYVMNKMGDEQGALGTRRTWAYISEIYRILGAVN